MRRQKQVGILQIRENKLQGVRKGRFVSPKCFQCGANSAAAEGYASVRLCFMLSYGHSSSVSPTQPLLLVPETPRTVAFEMRRFVAALWWLCESFQIYTMLIQAQ